MATAKCEQPSGVNRFHDTLHYVASHGCGISRYASSREFREFHENAGNDVFRGTLDSLGRARTQIKRKKMYRMKIEKLLKTKEPLLCNESERKETN